MTDWGSWGVPVPVPDGATNQKIVVGSAGHHHGRPMATPPFPNNCGFCNRPLPLGRDIYIYKGDTAFCSLDCREQKMKRDDERKERKKDEGGHIYSVEATTAYETST